MQPVIGLEVHARLLTKTKIFCGCPTSFGAPPNTHVWPVCLGCPGALPVLTRAAVELAIRAGLATGCTVHEASVFARKNYFYPDLPKGYQISQFDQPLCTDGLLEGVRIRRIHMEEDAGKSMHDAAGSRVDLNRAGVPLVEIVSEPDLTSAAQADAYLTRLRQILMYAGICDGNMEEGSLRCDANVSVHRAGEPLGTRTEVKNVNSFRFLRSAIEFEIARQTRVLESGGSVDQETRLFDPSTGETRVMRSKEEAHDYRYFPEPDLLTLVTDRAWIDDVARTLPQLHHARAPAEPPPRPRRPLRAGAWTPASRRGGARRHPGAGGILRRDRAAVRQRSRRRELGTQRRVAHRRLPHHAGDARPPDPTPRQRRPGRQSRKRGLRRHGHHGWRSRRQIG